MVQSERSQSKGATVCVRCGRCLGSCPISFTRLKRKRCGVGRLLAEREFVDNGWFVGVEGAVVDGVVEGFVFGDAVVAVAEASHVLGKFAAAEVLPGDCLRKEFRLVQSVMDVHRSGRRAGCRLEGRRGSGSAGLNAGCEVLNGAEEVGVFENAVVIPVQECKHLQQRLSVVRALLLGQVLLNSECKVAEGDLFAVVSVEFLEDGPGIAEQRNTLFSKLLDHFKYTALAGLTLGLVTLNQFTQAVYRLSPV